MGLCKQVVGQNNVQFAPIGLLDMFNSVGAIVSVDYRDDQSKCMVNVQVQGCGRFGSYSNTKSKSLSVDKKE